MTRKSKLTYWCLIICTSFLAIVCATSGSQSNTSSSSTSTSQQTTSSSGCCSELKITAASLDLSKYPTCKKNCLDGLILSGIDCANQSPLPWNDWDKIQIFLNDITTITGHFMLVGITSCHFKYTNLQRIKAKYFIVDDVNVLPQFMQNLTSIEPTEADCKLMLNITRDLKGKSDVGYSRIAEAMKQGLADCLASKPATTTPQPITFPKATPCPQALPLPNNPAGIPQPVSNSKFVSSGKATAGSHGDNNDHNETIMWLVCGIAIFLGAFIVIEHLAALIVWLFFGRIWEKAFRKIKSLARKAAAFFMTKDPESHQEPFAASKAETTSD